MFAKRVFEGAVLAAVLGATPVSAAVVELKFQDTAGATANTQDYGPNVYFDWQNDFRNASGSGDFDFQFTYDTEASGPNHGLTLVSGRVGTYTDFAAWVPTLQFTPGASLMVSLVRREELSCCLSYTSGVYFLLADNDGDIPATLPSAVTLADLDQATAGFENRRSGGVGLGYKNIGFSRFEGTFAASTGAGGSGGAIPEPSAWALMIAGFGAVGSMIRRRRGAAFTA